MEVIRINKKYTRHSVKNDTDSMYIFTDNAERTSRPMAQETNVDTEGWYYKKYHNQTSYMIHYGSDRNPTSAVIRGLYNAYPISTMKDYKRNWKESDFALFKTIIDDELSEIKNNLNKFKYMKIGNFKIGQGGKFARLPKLLQDYLDMKLLEIGIDNHL